MASTGYRFWRHYMGNSLYRRAGPPQVLLRLIAPIVVVSTAAVFVTGIELWLFGLRFGSAWVEAHKLSFWSGLPATGVHVLGHLNGSSQAAAEEISLSYSRSVITRRSLVLASLITGPVLATASLTYSTPFISSGKVSKSQ